MRRAERLLAGALVAASLASGAAAFGQMPAGHPPAARADAQEGAVPGMFQPSPDTAEEDEGVPAGTVSIVVLDPDNHPMPGVQVTLGIVKSSVAKGESRERIIRDTGPDGSLKIPSLTTGSGVSYRVTVPKDGAVFSSTPFALPPQRGVKVVQHVYPVTRDIEQALIVDESINYVELKDDRIQIQQAYRIYNFGRTAWVPENLVLPLPEGFTALVGQQNMTDVGVDAVEKEGARLRGTFGPGRWDVELRWQLPYSGEKDVSFDIGMPPHLAAARVMAAAAQGMTLSVDGFPAAQESKNAQGERVLVTVRQLTRGEPSLKTLKLSLRDIPTAGPARIVATCLAALGVALGVGLLLRAGKGRAAKDDRKDERSLLLADLEELVRAHIAGDVGPKTYERARREIIDALARTFPVAD